VFEVPNDVSCGWRLSLCSRCLLMFPFAGDCLCVRGATVRTSCIFFLANGDLQQRE
jgi:hypothetical protein